MAQISKIFRRFMPQLLHMITLPVFFFTFFLMYRPFNCEEFMGAEWFGVHLTISTCIVLLSIIVMRLLYYFLPMKLNYSLYILWCFAETIFTSFFMALYIWLVREKPMPYFETFTICFQYLSMSLIFPYVILAISQRLYEYINKAYEPDEASHMRMRFYDSRHNLKIVLLSEAILYIASEENYITINYTENEKLRSYVLRSSMKAIEELCQDHGLVRCHRSYYINPKYIKVLRKNRDGVITAELISNESLHIPVSKRYYDRVSELLQ